MFYPNKRNNANNNSTSLLEYAIPLAIVASIVFSAMMMAKEILFALASI